MRESLHDRLLDAARDITTADGWSALTMGAVAERAGISRQHLYNAIGTKHDLGVALVRRETDGFLALMCGRLRAHPDAVVAGVRAAVRGAREHGAGNTLLKAVLQADDSGGVSLLPLITARPEAVLAQAEQAVRAELRALLPHEPPDLDVAVDGVVRLVVSHLTQPTGPVEHAVRQCEAIVRAVLPR